MVQSAFFSNEGMQGAYFLGAIDLDLTRPDGKMSWKVGSGLPPSFAADVPENLALVSSHANTP
jgi:hypothetical protein